MHQNLEFTCPDQFVKHSMVIGLNVNDILASIFDIFRQMIVICNGENILLPPEDTSIFPYFRPVNSNPEHPGHSLLTEILNEMFNHLKRVPCENTLGISYYQAHFNGPLVNVRQRQHRVVRRVLVLGLYLGNMFQYSMLIIK